MWLGHGREELYLYPPSGPHRAYNGITLPLRLPLEVKVKCILVQALRFCTGRTAHGGHAVAFLVEAPRYKPEGSGFDSRWCHCNFSLT